MKKKFHGTIFFLAGLLAASVFWMSIPNVQQALADEYACIRQDLNAKLYNGNIPQSQFTLVYEVPSCLRSGGYNINAVYIYQGTMVAVTYKKATSGSGVQSFGSPGGSGGMTTIP